MSLRDILLPCLLLAVVVLLQPATAFSTPIADGYSLVPAVTTATYGQMLGLYPIPGAPDEAVVITQNGYLWRVSITDAFSPAPFGDISSKLLLGSEEGLAGLAFSPQYTTDGRVYLYYTAPPPDPPPDPNNSCCRDILARFQATGDALDLASEVLLIDQFDREPWHVGGQLAFGPDGYLYVSLGDEGWVEDPYDNGQNKAALYGKILRIDVTGQSTYAIPAGNPFADGPGGNADEIYAYGFRNPWRFSFDTATGDLWAGDVGQYYWEEVNKVVSGGNYGWDIMEGYECRSGPACTPPADHVPPRAAYCHPQWVSTCPGYPTPGECAIIGGFVYRGAAIPELDGWYVYGDYCSGKIWALDAATSGPSVLLTDSPYLISSFAQLPDGELLVLTYNNALYRLTSDGDGDLITNTVEEVCGSDPLNAASVPERIDGAFAGVDDDGDSDVDEALPAGAEAYDCDGDGFVGSIEIAIGTEEQAFCPGGSVADAWPLDNVVSGFANVTDVLSYRGKVPSPVDPGHPKRLDLDDNDFLNINDVLEYRGKLPSSCG